MKWYNVTDIETYIKYLSDINIDQYNLRTLTNDIRKNKTQQINEAIDIGFQTCKLISIITDLDLTALYYVSEKYLSLAFKGYVIERLINKSMGKNSRTGAGPEINPDSYFETLLKMLHDMKQKIKNNIYARDLEAKLFRDVENGHFNYRLKLVDWYIIIKKAINTTKIIKDAKWNYDIKNRGKSMEIVTSIREFKYPLLIVLVSLSFVVLKLQDSRHLDTFEFTTDKNLSHELNYQKNFERLEIEKKEKLLDETFFTNRVEYIMEKIDLNSVDKDDMIFFIEWRDNNSIQERLLYKKAYDEWSRRLNFIIVKYTKPVFFA